MPPTLFALGSTLFPPATAGGSNYAYQPPAAELKPSAYHSVNINAGGSPNVPILRLPSTTEHNFINPSLSNGLIIELPANPGLQKRATSPTRSTLFPPNLPPFNASH